MSTNIHWLETAEEISGIRLLRHVDDVQANSKEGRKVLDDGGFTGSYVEKENGGIRFTNRSPKTMLTCLSNEKQWLLEFRVDTTQ